MTPKREIRWDYWFTGLMICLFAGLGLLAVKEDYEAYQSAKRQLIHQIATERSIQQRMKQYDDSVALAKRVQQRLEWLDQNRNDRKRLPGR
jgi:hypothetical protein